MGNKNVTKITKGLSNTLTKRSPEILTGLGIAGMVTTTVLAVKTTPKALKLIEEEKKNREIDRKHGIEEQFAPVKVSAMDVIKLTWKCYLPSALICSASIACLIGASSVNLKRNAVLATAYKLSETAFTEYKEKVVETIGDKKEHTVREKIAAQKIKNNPVSKNEVIITDRGTQLCYDALGGRYFYSSQENVKKARNNLNAEMLQSMYVSLNDFYDELGLSHTKLGDELGWNLDDGMVEIDFNAMISDDGRPCIVVDYMVAPSYNYYKFG